jgi:pimeloyl-ACP methyl ester carboxylesterase
MSAPASCFNHETGRHLSVGSARIYYELHGRDTDPPLVFLHGGMGTIEDFNGVLTRLQGRHWLIGIDSRGQGRSTLGSDGLSYQLIQTDVQAVLDHLGLRQVDVIGFSDGGIAALRLASASGASPGASSASRIRKLVCIGTDMSFEADGPLREIYQRVTPQSWRAKFPGTYDVYQRVNPEPAFDALVEAIVQMWQDTTPQGYPGGSVQRITSELLVVHGDDDHLVSRQRTFALAEQVKGARLLNIPFAGHVAHDDQPELAMLGINAFLQHQPDHLGGHPA